MPPQVKFSCQDSEPGPVLQASGHLRLPLPLDCAMGGRGQLHGQSPGYLSEGTLLDLPVVTQPPLPGWGSRQKTLVCLG